MCDYCDCRTRPLLRALGAEHDVISTDAARLRRQLASAAGDAALAATARALTEALEPHARTEEAGLYVELARAGVETAAMEAEHRAIDEAFAEAAAGTIRTAALVEALDALARHIHAEEYDLFPAAHQVLDDDAWDRLDPRD